jgi:putative flippase GtrA
MASIWDEAPPSKLRTPPPGAKCRALASLPTQFLRYVACAGLAAAVNYAVGSVLVEGLGFVSTGHFAAVVATAYIAGMAVNFELNRRFTFASDRTCIAQGRTFIIVALSGLGLTIIAAQMLRSAIAASSDGFYPQLLGPLGTPESLGRATAIAVAAVYSFAAHKYLTFNRGIRQPLIRVMRALHSGEQLGRT